MRGTPRTMDKFPSLHRLRKPPNARVSENIPTHIVSVHMPQLAFRTHATQGCVIKKLYKCLIGGNTDLVSRRYRHCTHYR
jgi:hypothetical protein